MEAALPAEAPVHAFIISSILQVVCSILSRIPPIGSEACVSPPAALRSVSGACRRFFRSVLAFGKHRRYYTLKPGGRFGFQPMDLPAGTVPDGSIEVFLWVGFVMYKSASKKIIPWTFVGLLVFLLLFGSYFLLDKIFLAEREAEFSTEPILAFSPSQYRQKLEGYEKEKGKRLPAELKAVRARLSDLERSYRQYMDGLGHRLELLDKKRESMRERSPSAAALLKQVMAALKEGDDRRADELLAELERQSADDKQGAAETAFQRGGVAEDNVRYGDALEHYRRAAALAPKHALYLENSGRISALLENYQQAARYFERALESYSKTHGEDHSEAARVRNNLGTMWHALGEHEKAIAYYEQALAADIKTYGEDHPSVAADRSNLGAAWYALGEYEKAIAYFERTLAAAAKTHGEDHPDAAREYNNLGLAWGAAGEHEKAVAYFERALAALEKTSGMEHPHTRTVRSNLARVQAKLKEAANPSAQDSSAGEP